MASQFHIVRLRPTSRLRVKDGGEFRQAVTSLATCTLHRIPTYPATLDDGLQLPLPPYLLPTKHVIQSTPSWCSPAVVVCSGELWCLYVQCIVRILSSVVLMGLIRHAAAAKMGRPEPLASDGTTSHPQLIACSFWGPCRGSGDEN